MSNNDYSKLPAIEVTKVGNVSVPEALFDIAKDYIDNRLELDAFDPPGVHILDLDAAMTELYDAREELPVESHDTFMGISKVRTLITMARAKGCAELILFLEEE